jgi:hypothetical protein
MSLKFYQDLLNSKKPVQRQKQDDTDKIKNLYKVPLRDKGVNMPHFQYYAPNLSQQADLLFLPNDAGFKYALVVADEGSRLVDAEPLKDKDGASITQAFKTIYKRGILKKPEVLTVDPGSEFKGDAQKSLEEMGITIKRGKVARHRQLGIVERKNQMIGKLIHFTIASVEEVTGNASSQWIKYLPIIVKAINEKVKLKTPKQQPLTVENIGEPVCKGDSCKLLEPNQKVRVILEAPIDYLNGSRLHGKFRSGDIRWSKEIHTIAKVILKPKFPPLYLLKGDTNTAYTKNQLQPVNENEKVQNVDFIDKDENKDRYVVEKLMDRKVEKRTIYYLVKWKNYREATWEKKSNLIKDIPDMIRKYDDKYL